jgi:UV excision repair protein RAD23
LAQQQQQHPQQVPQSVGGPGGRVDPRILGALAQNPDALQPLIQQLAATNPQLAALAMQHPEQLLNLLGGGDEGDDEGEPIPPGATVVHVTAEEQAAIERVHHLPKSPQFHVLTLHIRSWKLSAFRERTPLKRTLRVIRMKN